MHKIKKYGVDREEFYVFCQIMDIEDKIADEVDNKIWDELK